MKSQELSRNGLVRCASHCDVHNEEADSNLSSIANSKCNAQDPQRTRLRDNKRRSRLRQKQYIADLEGKLAQLQREGITATKEVQASARRVDQDNIRLRALLRYTGVDDNTINTWTPEGTKLGYNFLPSETCDLVKGVECVSLPPVIANVS
jgi:hypothetical protein